MAAGASMRVVPAYDPSDNPALAPPLRERSYKFRPRGRSYDPRVQWIKDTPGPITIIEIGMEATV